MVENKKVLWIFNHYAILPYMTGGTRHYDFAKELFKRGYKVYIIASSFNHSLHKETKTYINGYFHIEEYNGVGFVWIKTPGYKTNNWKRLLNMIVYSIRAYKATKKINIEKPDYIIGSSVHLFAALTGHYVARREGKPFIMEVRDIWPETLINFGISKYNPVVIFFSFLERYLYKKAKKIIILLPRGDVYLKAKKVYTSKINIIPNGVDLNRFPIDYDVIRNNYEHNDNLFKLYYMGSMGKANNLDVLLNVAKKLKVENKNIKFVIIGDGPEKGRLIQRVKNEKIDNIEFQTAIPKDLVQEIGKRADAFILSLGDYPLYRYGISLNKLFDYLAMAKPVIFLSNLFVSLPEIPDSVIKLNTDNIESIVEAINKLSNMSIEERLEIGKKARKYVEENHSVSVLVDKLEKLFNEFEC